MPTRRTATTGAAARAWHALTAATALVAVALQLSLVVDGAAVLVDTDPPTLPLRLVRFVAYFTVQSNVLVLVSTCFLVRDPARDGRSWRVARGAAVVGISVTGLVHYVLLRPLLDLDGANAVADWLLHVAVPLLTVAGWLALGPRPRFDARVVASSLAWPVVWLLVTLAVGGATGWFPYPFLDVRSQGWASVLVACAGLTGLFVVVITAFHWIDHHAGRRPRGSS